MGTEASGWAGPWLWRGEQGWVGKHGVGLSKGSWGGHLGRHWAWLSEPCWVNGGESWVASAIMVHTGLCWLVPQGVCVYGKAQLP